MEYKANYAIVGAFATLAVAALLGFIYWFSTADAGGERMRYDVVFTGAVTGLSGGTEVLFNGIRVGEVLSVSVDPEDPNRVIAGISVLESAPVMNDTRAVLEVQGLTGMAYIQLLGGTLEAGRVTATAEAPIPTLTGEPSDFQVIFEGARDIVASAESTFSRIDRLLLDNEERVGTTIANIEQLTSSLAMLAEGADEDGDFQALVAGARDIMDNASSTFERLDVFFAANEQSVSASIANTEAFTGALAANADGLETFLASVTEASDQIGPLADEMRNLTTDVRGIVEAIPPEQVSQTFDDVSSFANVLARNTETVEGFFDDARILAANLSGISEGLQQTLSLIDEASDAIDPDIIARAMRNVDRFSIALGDNAPAVDDILQNTRALTESLSDAAERIDTITMRIDSMVASEDGGELFGEIAQAAEAVRILAEQLDARTAEITAGITNFTSRGLGDYTGLATDARGTLRRLDRILANFERNPQLLVFGGDSVREFQSR